MKALLKKLSLISKIIFYNQKELDSFKLGNPKIEEKKIKGEICFESFVDNNGLQQVVGLMNGQIITLGTYGLVSLFDGIGMTLKLEINLENDEIEQGWKTLQGGQVLEFIKERNIIVTIVRYYLDCENSEYGGPEKYRIYWIDKSSFKIIHKEFLNIPIYSFESSRSGKYLVGRTRSGIVCFSTSTYDLIKKVDLPINNKFFFEQTENLLITCYNDLYPFNKKIQTYRLNDQNKSISLKEFENGSIDAFSYSQEKNWIATFSKKAKVLKVLELNSLEVIIEVPIQYIGSDIPMDMNFSMQSKYLALQLRHSIIVMETEKFQILKRLEHPIKDKSSPSKDGYITNFSFSNSDNNIITSTSDGYLRIWS